jgi:hypothetical protein
VTDIQFPLLIVITRKTSTIHRYINTCFSPHLRQHPYTHQNNVGNGLWRHFPVPCFHGLTSFLSETLIRDTKRAKRNNSSWTTCQQMIEVKWWSTIVRNVLPNRGWRCLVWQSVTSPTRYLIPKEVVVLVLTTSARSHDVTTQNTVTAMRIPNLRRWILVWTLKSKSLGPASFARLEEVIPWVIDNYARASIK